MVADRRRQLNQNSFTRLLQEARKRQVEDEEDKTMSAAKFFVPTLPGLPEDSNLKMWSGHIPSGDSGGDQQKGGDSHLFFFMIKNRHIADKSRTVFWFNGGPGCSSFDGSLMEIGPLRLVPGSNGQLKEVDGAWNEYANIIFIDQPAGTGYSYTNSDAYLHELPEVGKHLVEFFKRFFRVFPELSTHETYLAGESYAGQYIPYIATAVLESAEVSMNLKGILLGNPWIDPLQQYPAYLDFSLQAGVIKAGTTAEKNIRKRVDECVSHLTRPGHVVKVHNGQCEGILNMITDSTRQTVNGKIVCINNYDVRLTDSYPACGMNWPPDLMEITPYLQRQEVKNAFHADRKKLNWVECNNVVGTNFWALSSSPAVTLVPKLLESIEVLFFAGDQDMICNHVGVERMIEKLTWDGQIGFGPNSTALEWWVDGKEAGTWQSARGLTYVKIKDASHMVPYDKPIEAHDMFLRFVGANLLGAAGPAAQVPSRVGDELEAVLGETHPNGTAVNGPVSSDKHEEIPISSTIDTIANATTILLLLAIFVMGFGAYYMMRKRRFSRRHGYQQPKQTAFTDENAQELENLVQGDERNDDISGDDYSRVEKGEPTRHSQNKLTTEEEIFNLGSDDDDDTTRNHKRSSSQPHKEN